MLLGRLVGTYVGSPRSHMSIVRTDKAMQGKTMVHIGEEGGECTMPRRSFPQCLHRRKNGTMSWLLLHQGVCVIFSQNICFVSKSVRSLSEAQDHKEPKKYIDFKDLLNLFSILTFQFLFYCLGEWVFFCSFGPITFQLDHHCRRHLF